MSEVELIRLRELLKSARSDLIKAIRIGFGEVSDHADEADRKVYCALVRVERAIEDKRGVTCPRTT